MTRIQLSSDTMQHERSFATSSVMKLALALALFGVLYSFYLLTYTGTTATTDERWLVDQTESFAMRGTFEISQTADLLRTVPQYEPLQPILASVLYFIAARLEFVGNFHTLFLFNPLVTALTGVVLYAYAWQLGYRQSIALLAGLLFGVGTIAWPYTRTFFREPLAALFLLTSFYFLHRCRKRFAGETEGRYVLCFVLGLGAFTLAVLTKEATVIAAPLVLAYAMPPLANLRIHRRHLIALAIGVLVVAVILLAIAALLKLGDNTLTKRYAGLSEVLFVLERVASLKALSGFVGLLISPGRSIFIYSPIALLLVGTLVSRRIPHQAETWLALAMVLVFALVYGARYAHGYLWIGGSSWGPRHMVPVTPFLVLGALPLLKYGLDGESRWPKAGLAALMLFSFFIQIPGVLINIHDYFGLTSGDVTGPLWVAGLWQPRYSQWLSQMRLLATNEWDVIWVRLSFDVILISVLLASVALFAGLLIWLTRREITRKLAWLMVVGSLGIMSLATGILLIRGYDDLYYLAGYTDLHTLVDYLDEAVQPDEPILLGNTAFREFFSNYYKGDSVWFTMPTSPGERPSPEHVPLVISNDPEELIADGSKDLIRGLEGDSPFWLIMNSGPFTPWDPRPPEWWAAVHYYPVKIEEISPIVRAVQYLSYPAPDLDTPPSNLHGGRLSDSITLIGYDLGGGRNSDERVFRPGDELGVSLVWQAERSLVEDYIAAVFIIGPQGQVILQQDRPPVATFRSTTSWEPGEILRDNYGFILPDDLPPGEYQVWAIMYRWPAIERLPVTSAQGDDVSDRLVLTSFTLVAGETPPN